MAEIYVWYVNSTGQEKSYGVETNERCVNLDLRDMISVDLLPLIWCRNLEDLSIRNNKLTEIDLSPLSKCPNLQGLRLNNNQLEKLNLFPLAECSMLEELAIQANRLKRVDISPLFHCHALKELNGTLVDFISFIGEPFVALLIGVFLALLRLDFILSHTK